MKKNNYKQLNKNELSKLAFSILEKNQKIELLNVIKRRNHSDEELLDFYIGNNSEKITKRFINFSAFFLGPIYYYYRKLYITGSIFLLIYSLLLLTIKNYKIVLLVEFLLFLVLSLLFNKFYVFICKKKINRIKNKYDEDKITEMCIILGGTNTLNVYLIIITYIIMIILFFSSPILKLINEAFNIENKKSASVDIYSEYVDMIESYAITAKQNIGSSSLYKYTIDEQYYFIALPQAKDDGNIYCIKESKEEEWTNKKGFETKDNSTDCNEFMSDIVTNYSKFYNIELPVSGQIVLNSDGLLENGTYVKYEKVKCNYDKKKKKMNCK